MRIEPNSHLLELVLESLQFNELKLSRWNTNDEFLPYVTTRIMQMSLASNVQQTINPPPNAFATAIIPELFSDAR